MQKVLTAAEMREVDRLTTEEYGIPSVILMENAAGAVARVVREELGGSVYEKLICILCGRGNNGGDGSALARMLLREGAWVEVVLLGEPSELSGDALLNFTILQKNCGPVASNPNRFIGAWFGTDTTGGMNLNICRDETEWLGNKELHRAISATPLIVDAMLGTGLTRPVTGLYELAIDHINHLRKGLDGNPPKVVSIDVPSGLNADSSEVIGSTVQADRTVTFTTPKPANVMPQARNFGGQLTVADIGSPFELTDEALSQLYLSDASDVAKWLTTTTFSSSSYKNKRGHALIVAGSENYSGAAVLCGNAAIRSGVGLITIGTPRSSKDSIAGRVVPEVMVRPLAETETGSVAEEAFEEIEDFSDNVDAIAIGSGLAANSESTGRLVRRLVKERTMPTVLDADGLTLLSPFDADEIKDESKPPLILTPHQGEFLKMLGTKDADSIKDRVAAVREFAQKHHVILVLKGERNLIAEPGGKVVVNPTGNSGLGKAGNGDTLTGIVVGFAAQAAVMEVDMFETVVAAVYLAGLAGDIAEKKFGKRVMTASDVRDCLGEAFAAVERA